MIISIRGTGGAGKSTLVKSVMGIYTVRVPRYEEGRRRPVGYVCATEPYRQLFVPGHYETPCGGCDTLKSPGEAYRLIEAASDAGRDVIFEGIIVQDDVRRCIEVSKRHKVAVIGLDVPIEVCLDSIRHRRKERGDARPLNPKNTIDRANRLVGIMSRLADAGIETAWMDREQALIKCVGLLGMWHYSNTPKLELMQEGLKFD